MRTRSSSSKYRQTNKINTKTLDAPLWIQYQIIKKFSGFFVNEGEKQIKGI